MGLAQRDYLLRMIEQLGAFLARLSGLRAAGNTDEALRAIEEALDGFFGPMKTLLNDVDSATAASLLGSSDKLRVFARLMMEKGHVYELKQDHAVARVAFRRSLELYLESARAGEDVPDEALSTMRELRGLVSEDRLSDRYRTRVRDLLGP